jgi:transposase
MPYELSDYEWTAIKPMLPNKPRGVRRVNDRRVLSGIFWVLRSGAPWRDLPETYGPRTTCYNLQPAAFLLGAVGAILKSSSRGSF